MTLDRYSFSRTIYSNVNDNPAELDKLLKKLRKKIHKNSRCRRGEINIVVNLCYKKDE